MSLYSAEQYSPHFRFRKQLGGYLNRKAYERNRNQKFVPETFTGRIVSKIMDLFTTRIQIESNRKRGFSKKKKKDRDPKHDSSQTRLRELDQAIHNQLEKCWPLLRRFAIHRSVFDQQFGLYAFQLDQKKPPVPALLILQAFLRGQTSLNSLSWLEERWGVYYDRKHKKWKMID